MGSVAPRLCSMFMLVLAGTVCAQNYPAKTVRIVTPEVGGGGDFVARLIAQGLALSFHQSVIVDNRGGMMPIITVANALPDGYTILLYMGTLWTTPLLQTVPYDPVRDFAPITLAVSSPNVLVITPSLAAGSVAELIALAKAKPGQLNYGSGATGAAPHLAAELFKAMAGLDIVRVPYKGTGPAINGLMGGETQLMFPNAAAVASHVRTGRLKALAVTTAGPSLLVPGLPTVAATLPGYESASILAMFAPARTPPAIVTHLNREIVNFLNKADVKERLFNSGVEAVAGSPEELAAVMKSEMARLGKVIRDAGIRAD